MLEDAAAVVVPNLLNARVVALHAAQAALTSASGASASSMRDTLDVAFPDAIDPAAVAAMFPDHEVKTVWARSGDLSRFDAIIYHRGTVVDVARPEHARPIADYANRPAQAAEADAGLFDDLRAHVREFLPEYMTPSIFLAVKALPLTPNGKIDRKALPRASQSVAAPVEAYLKPSNEVEESIANVWKALLGLERVGRRDNIFDLGANSLLTVQANQRLSTLLDRKISLVSMFRYPSIEALASHLMEGKPGASEPAGLRTFERETRKKDAAARRRELRAAGGS